MTGVATRGSSIAFGEFGLKAMECGWRVFPHKPITKKAAGARMGSGKADIHAYVAVIRPGTIIFELSGVTAEMAKEAMRLAAHKIGVATKFIVKA